MTKLNWKEVKEIFISSGSTFNKIQWPEAFQSVSLVLKVKNDELFLAEMYKLRSKFNKMKSFNSVKRIADDNLIVLDNSNFNIEEVEEPVEKRAKFYKVIDNLSRKQQKRRLEDIFESVRKSAAEESIEIHRLLGFLLSCCDKKKYADIGKRIWEDADEDKASTSQIPLITAMTMYNDCSLGKSTYSKQRKLFSKVGFNILPPWVHLREEQRKLSTPVLSLPDPHVGVYFKFLPAVKMTIQRILDGQSLSASSPITLNMKFGFDGSGSHAIYSQANNEDTNNIIQTMFCPLEIISEGNKIWIQTSPNSALSQRPLMLQMGKESVEKLQSLTLFNNDIQEMKNGFEITTETGMINAKANILAYTMDLKAAHLYLGMGGAYCDLCAHSKEQCMLKEVVQQGFNITRNVDSIHDIFDELVQEDGFIAKAPLDYNVRKGVTTKPIATNDAKSVQVLHALLRTFDCYMKVVTHCKARILQSSVSKTSRMMEFLKAAKSQLQEHIRSKLNIKWDFPDATGKGGTTTKGNTARELLFSKENRDVITSQVDHDFVPLLNQFGEFLSTVIRIISSKQRVKVENYKDYCKEFNLFLIDKFPWMSITPSLHKVLAHSWELIEMNDGCGLGMLDESGMEGCNKILRHIRTLQARKTSQNANLTDILNRMWMGSDPKISLERTKALPYCKQCKEMGHSTRYCFKRRMQSDISNEDALFESFIDK